MSQIRISLELEQSLINKDENVHRFALSAIRGREREREKEERERDPYNLEGEFEVILI